MPGSCVPAITIWLFQNLPTFRLLLRGAPRSCYTNDVLLRVMPCLQSFFRASCEGAHPPAPARQSGLRPGSTGNARIGRKCRLFARAISSPNSQIGNIRAPIGESLWPRLRIFPFCRDYRQRRGSIATAARRLQRDLTNPLLKSPRIVVVTRTAPRATDF